MQITVAGEKKEVKDGLTLPELIEQENVETPEYVTVSINDEFIETEAKATTVLKANHPPQAPALEQYLLPLQPPSEI